MSRDTKIWRALHKVGAIWQRNAHVYMTVEASEDFSVAVPKHENPITLVAICLDGHGVSYKRGDIIMCHYKFQMFSCVSRQNTFSLISE